MKDSTNNKIPPQPPTDLEPIASCQEQLSQSRRRLLTLGLTAGAVYATPTMSFASPAATLSGGITPADILQMLQDIADMAEDMENSFRRCIAEMLGLTPAELQALQDGIDAALDLRDMALAGKLSFAGLAATQQVLLAIGTAILVDKIATGLNVINGKIAELDAALPGIPAAGFADDVTAALDEFGNDVRDLRDDWDAKVPLAGTVILGPIAAASEVLETLWGLSIGGIFD